MQKLVSRSFAEIKPASSRRERTWSTADQLCQVGTFWRGSFLRSPVDEQRSMRRLLLREGGKNAGETERAQCGDDGPDEAGKQSCQTGLAMGQVRLGPSIRKVATLPSMAGIQLQLRRLFPCAGFRWTAGSNRHSFPWPSFLSGRTRTSRRHERGHWKCHTAMPGGARSSKNDGLFPLQRRLAMRPSIPYIKSSRTGSRPPFPIHFLAKLTDVMTTNGRQCRFAVTHQNSRAMRHICPSPLAHSPSPQKVPEGDYIRGLCKSQTPSRACLACPGVVSQLLARSRPDRRAPAGSSIIDSSFLLVRLPTRAGSPSAPIALEASSRFLQVPRPLAFLGLLPHVPAPPTPLFCSSVWEELQLLIEAMRQVYNSQTAGRPGRKRLMQQATPRSS